MDLTKILSKDAYIVVNKEVIRKVGIDAAMLLSELCREYDYYNSVNKLNDGYFYSTIENILNNIGIKSKKQREIIETLKMIGVISTKLEGLPAKRHFKINERVLMDLVNPIDLNQLNTEKNKLDLSNRTNNIVQDELEILIDNNISNNINNNKEIKNIQQYLYCDKGTVGTISSPKLKDLESLNLDLDTKRMIYFLEKEIYARYLGKDKEKILLLYKWIIERFSVSEGIQKTQLIKQLEVLDNLDREVQINNIKYCIMFGERSLVKDYADSIESHKKYLGKDFLDKVKL